MKLTSSILLVLAILAADAGAALRPLHPGRSVGFAWAKPEADGDPTAFVASAFELHAAFPLDDGSIVDVTVPAAYWDGEGRTEFGFGNPRLRFTSTAFDRETLLDFALTLPLASGRKAAAQFQGLRTRYVHDVERFASDVAALAVGLERPYPIVEGRLAIRPRAEGSLWIRTEDVADGETLELFLRPALGLLFTHEVTTVLLELRTSYWPTSGSVIEIRDDTIVERDRTFDESTVQDLLLEAEFAFASVRPAVSMAFSLDDELDAFAEWVFGLRATFLLD